MASRYSLKLSLLWKPSNAKSLEIKYRVQLSRLGVKDDAIPAGSFGVVKSFIGTSNYFLRIDCFRSIQATPKLEVTRMDWVR